MDDARAGEMLNTLLRSARDSAEGFRQGADLARNPAFQSLFRERAEERSQLVHTLEDEVRSFGVEPVGEGTLVGEAHRLFTYARNAVSRGSDKGLVEELVRREKLVTRNFEAMVGADFAPEPTRRFAADALGRLTAEQRELEDLGDQFHRAAE